MPGRHGSNLSIGASPEQLEGPIREFGNVYIIAHFRCANY